MDTMSIEVNGMPKKNTSILINYSLWRLARIYCFHNDTFVSNYIEELIIKDMGLEKIDLDNFYLDFNQIIKEIKKKK